MLTYIKVLFAIAFGAFAGATLSLEHSAGFGLYELMWLPGMVVGGVLGWVCVSPQHAGVALRRACRQSIRAVPARAHVYTSVAKLPARIWSALAHLWLAFSATFGLTLYPAGGVMMIVLWKIQSGVPYDEFLEKYFWPFLLHVTTASLLWTAVAATGTKGELLALRRQVTHLPFHITISLPAWTIFYMIVALQQAIAHVPFVLRWVCDIGVTAYRYANTHQREYAFGWAAAGAGIGHFTFSALLGAVAGVVGALVSYGVLYTLHRTYAARAR